MNNPTFDSGKEYTLAKVFSGKHKIIIPDLQRDYCWGDKAWSKEKEHYTELVGAFISNLLSTFNEKPNDNLMLGLIYGYENPHYHVQLCDGQQRITTLFLLIGMLCRKSENENLKKYLISEFELKNDDKEPNLQYSIRESTLYFLSDLVCHFFLDKESEISLQSIRKQNWYFEEYNLDASIQSMLAALDTIEKKLSENEINYSEFGDYITNKLQVLYYDMGNRIRGEETFVIINTTGEPLTATENLKPIIIGSIKENEKREVASNEWEDREEWFWHNKSEKEQTSDKALNDFFIWYWQIRLLQEKSWKKKKEYELNPLELFTKKPIIDLENEENPVIESWEESRKPETIQKYFGALKKLIELSKNDDIANILKTIKDESITLSWFRNRKTDLHIILPFIAYLVKFPNPDYFPDFVRRIRKNHYDKVWKERNKNHVDWRYILQIIDFVENNEEEKTLQFLTLDNKEKFKPISNVLLNEWYTREEEWKFELKKINKYKVEAWEDNPDFMGELSPLLNITNKSIDIESIDNYYLNYTQINPSNFTYQADIEIKNLYSLSSLLDNGWFDHRAVGGLGYCMLSKSSEKAFSFKNFNEVWNAFTNNASEIKNILKKQIISHYNFLNSVDSSIDIKSIKHYDLIKLWALLEFLNSKNNFEINYSDSNNSIACFWDKSKVIINENVENKYQIGNLKLGVSWYNNKTGWLQFSFPLMKEINSNEINIEEQTDEYWKKINEFLERK